MTKLICSHDASHLPKVGPDVVPVLLFQRSDVGSELAYIGDQLHREVLRLPALPQPEAVDLLSLALTVIAGDTFVLRSDAANRWHREIDARVHLARPSSWAQTNQSLEKMLCFLSGDQWRIEFAGDGYLPTGKSHLRPDYKADCACLFSGGLDSTTGVIDLVGAGIKPLLVSQAYIGDASVQNELLHYAKYDLPRFAANVNPKRRPLADGTKFKYETSMRARSFLFLAMGVVAASAISNTKGGHIVDLVVPENGFISINPPLTPRRIGAQSTRTTHPYFLGLFQELLDSLGLPIKVKNPFYNVTKGEMMLNCADQKLLSKLAPATRSCGKWKRHWQQCGKCLPCLIRRASFDASGIAENADAAYRFPKLSDALALENDRDDVLAVIQAIKKFSGADVKEWARRSGPLPHDPAERAARVDVVSNGLSELRDFLCKHVPI